MIDEDFERYMTMRDIGKAHGVSSHVIGRWLTRLGLREGGQPTQKARQGGFCKEIYDHDRGIWFWVWRADKTLPALEELIQKSMEAKGAASGE